MLKTKHLSFKALKNTEINHDSSSRAIPSPTWMKCLQNLELSFHLLKPEGCVHFALHFHQHLEAESCFPSSCEFSESLVTTTGHRSFWPAGPPCTRDTANDGSYIGCTWNKMFFAQCSSPMILPEGRQGQLRWSILRHREPPWAC